MAEIHHFAYGWFSPVLSYLMAFLGALLGLLSLARARQAESRGRRARWLVLAAVSIGGAGVWLMHFMAMLGFDVPASPVRYDPLLTIASLGVAVLSVGIGLFIVGFGRRSRVVTTLLGGLIVGAGVFATHYTGIAALRVAGDISFDREQGALALAAIIPVAAAVGLAGSGRGWRRITAGAFIMAIAFVGMHYSAMAALRIELRTVDEGVSGLGPLQLIVPITLLAAAALIAMALSALQAMTEEEFTGIGAARPGPSSPAQPGGAHGETAWQLSQITTGEVVGKVPVSSR